MFLNGSSLIFGTSDAHLHVVNTKNAQDVKDFDLNLGTVVPVKVEGKNVYAIANDSFWKINYVKKKVNWVFKTDDFYQVEHAEIVGDKAFLSSKSGSLYVLGKDSGKLLWSLLSDQMQNYSQIEDGENYYYSLDFRVKEGAVYIANHLGKFYSVDIKTGKVRWFFDVGSGIVGKFGIYKDTAFVFSKDGNIFALNLKNGKLIWKQPAGEHAVCADIYKSNLVYQSVGGYIYKLNSKKWFSHMF